MKFEHTAALMLQSTAINSDRTKRAFAESIPVPDAREIAMAEFESAKHEISDAQYVECLDSAIGSVLIGIKSESFSTIKCSPSDDIKPVVIRHDVPLMWLTRLDIETRMNRIGFVVTHEDMCRFNKRRFYGEHIGECNDGSKLADYLPEVQS